jgi:ATP-dependent RNA helicase RhlE
VIGLRERSHSWELNPVLVPAPSDSLITRVVSRPDKARLRARGALTRGHDLPGFDDFGLLPPILDALASEGYATPTPIQAQAIPFILAGRDLCGIAQTGTGKTAAFALPILHRLAAQPRATPSRGCRVLVLSPTRELASQIADSFRTYGRRLRLAAATVFGGVPLGPQQRRLACGVDILVATPGRLLDLIERRAVILSGVETLVLDEADRMLDLGFIHALKRIARLLPRPRQTLLFSATMPRSIAALAEEYLDDPVRIAVAPAATAAERIAQSVILIPTERKRELLAALLRDPDFRRVLVFTRTKHGADRVVRHLIAAGIDAVAIHGNKSQPQRERALAGFRDGSGRVLVATDIAARGIDVDEVSHVINFDLPNVPEDYVHRIGRTARAGAVGTAVAFCSDEERPHLRGIEKLTRLTIPVMPIPASVREARQDAPAPLPAVSSTNQPRSEVARHRQQPARPAADAGKGRVEALPAFLRRDHGSRQAAPGRRPAPRPQRRAAR